MRKLERIIKMEFTVPEAITKVMKIMKENGYESFIVGGCVRDFLMGKTPSDFDITTNATPEQTKKCFLDFKVIETGIKHGTVTVLIDGEPVEITTYRIDGKYTDNRHPESVEFTVNLEDDLSRRDFTVNALAYDGEKRIVDLFSGKEDLKNKIIRCVGEPDKRFLEDGLRILRALRFSSVLDFSIEKDTEESIRKNKNLLNNISRERILSEMTKLLCGVNAKNVLLNFREVFECFIPELKNFVDYERSVMALSRISKRKEIRFSAFLSESEKPEKILKDLKSDNKTSNSVKALVYDLKNEIPDDKISIKKMLSTRDISELLDVLELKLAFGEDEKKCERITKIIKEIEENRDCVKIKDLLITGTDIIELGEKKGKRVGEILTILLDSVIEGKIKNEIEELKTTALKLICG